MDWLNLGALVVAMAAGAVIGGVVAVVVIVVYLFKMRVW